jgi:CubicO group peptidase (beta-lactamase class C family)
LRTLAKILVPSHLQKNPMPKGFASVIFDRSSVNYKATQGSNPKQIRIWPHTHNRREIWEAEGPSYGGITNAKSLARIAALMANLGELDNIRFISKEAILESLKPLPWMKDQVFSRNVTFSQGGLGIELQFPGSDLLWHGWGGVGGSMVFFNRETKISFAYVMNSMTLAGIGDNRSFRIIEQLIKCYENQKL